MTRLFKNTYRVALTTGDANGVGLEVAAKALVELKPSIKKTKTLFFLFRDRRAEKLQKNIFSDLDQAFVRLTFTSLDAALLFLNQLSSLSQIPDRALIDLSLDSSPADWALQASLACEAGLLTSLVTGPLSKTLTSRLKGRPLGHTGIFRRLYPGLPMFMAFVGRDFHVVLATDHIPLSKTEGTFNSQYWNRVLNAAVQFKQKLGLRQKAAVLGLNPHAGENSLIGKFEKKYAVQLKKYSRHIHSSFLSPDAAFLKKNWSKYALYVALYHDQGLIPFKMHHGQDAGVHITLGLPFVRTSVDHGTAYDLFNKNLANHNSMLDAIKLNLKLIGAKNV